MSMSPPRLGATLLGDDRCRFSVWAPHARHVEVKLGDRRHRLTARPEGYHEAVVEGVRAGDRYTYLLEEGVERPDPASRAQPDGVHGPSAVVELAHAWRDEGWRGRPLADYVIYELHPGTFTPEGTFDAAIAKLPELAALGITALELMPVAQCPGARNWGYDGVYPFAAQWSYGGPAGLARLVDACHREGLAVILDVVYNHLGPEGNYLRDFGPYFTSTYGTPWGEALNFDGAGSTEVRRFFVESALMWIDELHIDALRLDAVHAIHDMSARPFLEELSEAVHQRARRLGREVVLIAESDLNDPRLVRPPELGGLGLDGMWCDDLHHALHALLTRERGGYYEDFGRVEHLARAFARGATYIGERSPHRRRRHGRPFAGVRPEQVVVCSQNHDQVGNRMLGERLAALVGFEGAKLAAGVVLTSPWVPLLFMGEEHAETAPFQYFTSHGDPHLVEAVRRGRKEEFASFAWQGEAPDPQDEATFLRSRVRWEEAEQAAGRTMRALYQALIALRRELPRGAVEAVANEATRTLMAQRSDDDGEEAALIFHFGTAATRASVSLQPGRWRRALDSASVQWRGPGSEVPEELDSAGEVTLSLSPMSFVVLRKISRAE